MALHLRPPAPMMQEPVVRRHVPLAIPIDQLRRLIKYELAEAAEMAAKVFPSWKKN
jgi:hypothetical protein